MLGSVLVGHLEGIITDMEKSEKTIAGMFDRIAGSYDFLNHALSFGFDYYWRRKSLRQLKKQCNAGIILDIASGSGDAAILAAKILKPDKVFATDISEKMLKIAEAKIRKRKLDHLISVLVENAEKLTFNNDIFDAAIVFFGVRNFDNLDKGLTEIKRVLVNGGSLLILEFSKPQNWLVRQFYTFYLTKIIPFFGWLFSNDKQAYKYLADSILDFPDKNEFVEILKHNGFSDIKAIGLTFGVVTIYICKKNN